MENSIFHKLSNILWGMAVTAIVILAVYVSLGRLLSTNLQAYQEEVLAELNSRVPFHIEADRLSGEWHSFTPEIVLSGLRLSIPGELGDTLELSEGRIGLDVFDSLSSRSLQVTALQLGNLALTGELTADGRFILPGLTGNGGKVGKWLREFLLNIEYVTLRENSLSLQLPSGELRQFDIDLHLAREGSTRRLSAELISTRGTRIQVVGRGLGDPFSPEDFSGEFHLDLDSGDLGAVKDMLARTPAVWMEGHLDSELWFSWDHGKPTLDLSLQVSDVLVRPVEGDWLVPLDELTLKASLLERRNRWTLFAADVSVKRAETEVVLPRVQLDLWGESLRLRTEQVDLAPLNQLLLQLDSLPEKLASVFSTLQPEGRLSALAVSVSDLAAPAADWGVEANFEGLQVQSWRGAPGVTSANGYLDLAPGGGYVVLDSQQFTMDYPTVYRQPLYYDDFFGTLKLHWDSESLVLDSGLITAHGVEGRARALFRLDIPFTWTETGLEMDLVVGLEKTHPIHRAKYVPYMLNAGLLDWLSGAVGEGDVQQAGFVWRGSLRKKAGPLRTVQLFANLDNTSLDYHPQWPAIRAVNGTVLIDDTNVSVWADSARLFNSQLERLSAEAWLVDGGQMMLAIDGEMSGPAADGLAVVNESLLGELVGDAFSNWQASGQLRTSLQLELNLADKAVPPVVQVDTRWSDVDLDINPGKLPLRSLNGELSYSSASGFSSRDLHGSLWQEQVAAVVRQRPLPGQDSVVFGKSVLEVALDSGVAMADVQDWLSLEALTLAQGRAEVQGRVELSPGEKPLLILESDLQGVGLDLPPPWTKAASSSTPFSIRMPLGAEQSVLQMALGDDLALQLDITGGAMSGASLGIAAAPAPLQPATVLVTGQAALVDVAAWDRFINRYLVADSGDGGQASIVGEPTPALQVKIDALQAAQLLIWGRDIADVTFELDFGSFGWRVQAETEWGRGSYRQPVDGVADLDVEFLELSCIDQLVADAAVQSEAAPDVLQLPEMRVRVGQLNRQGAVLGDLNFKLDTQGPLLRIRGLTGHVAGMELGRDEPGSLDWQQGGQTQLTTSLHFSDFGQTLRQLGYEKFMETERGRLDLSLSWPGSPQEFSLAGGSGSVLIDVGEGRFLETPAGATGALKVVGVLNLAEVVQRLSLTHMFESGIPFHTIDGEVFLHSGTIEVTAVDVKGKSSGFSFSGISDVASRSLDGELVATLPVANNLPWVAALAGGLPIAAGVFVVSKVFEKQVNRLSSGVYSIGGTWDEPQISFDRIFDDATRQVVRQLIDPNGVLPDPASFIPDPNQPPPASGGVVVDPNSIKLPQDSQSASG